MPRRLGHDETLRWVRDHHAWRLASKTRAIWARPVDPAEVGHTFTTADYAEEAARPGYWLSVGVCGEPWFQSAEAIESKYERRGTEQRRFAFDGPARTYVELVPRTESRNWAACVAPADRPEADAGR